MYFWRRHDEDKEKGSYDATPPDPINQDEDRFCLADGSAEVDTKAMTKFRPSVIQNTSEQENGSLWITDCDRKTIHIFGIVYKTSLDCNYKTILCHDQVWREKVVCRYINRYINEVLNCIRLTSFAQTVSMAVYKNISIWWMVTFIVYQH